MSLKGISTYEVSLKKIDNNRSSSLGPSRMYTAILLSLPIRMYRGDGAGSFHPGPGEV